MNRREVLLGGGVALSASLAGCSSASDNESDGGPDNESDGDSDDSSDNPDSEGTTDPVEFQLIEAADDRWPTDETELLSLEETLDPTEPLYDRSVATGDSSAVTDGRSFDDGFLVIAFEREGDRFALDLEGETERTVISEFDAAEGMEPVRISSGEYRMNVEAEGDWKITVAQPSTPEKAVRTPSFEASGTGGDIIGPMKSVSLSEIGESLEYDGKRLGLANYHEDPETALKWVEIDVDGEWHLEVNP